MAAVLTEKISSTADRIRERREELGLKVVDLAAAAGVSISAVMQWESGQTKNLKNEYLFVIADALNLEPRWLALGEGPRIREPNGAAYHSALARRDRAGTLRAKTAWERIAAVYAKAAMALLLVLPPLLPDRADAAILHKQGCIAEFAGTVVDHTTDCFLKLRSALRNAGLRVRAMLFRWRNDLLRIPYKSPDARERFACG